MLPLPAWFFRAPEDASFQLEGGLGGCDAGGGTEQLTACFHQLGNPGLFEALAG